ncbi:MAG: nucleotidyltransferase domain-containing protein, partial [Propylenella sp.]
MQRLRIAESPIDEAGLKAALDVIATEHGAATPAARKAALELLKEVLANGRGLIRTRLEQDGKGLACAERLAALIDTIITALFDFATSHVFPVSNPSAAERLSLAAVGGYGRGTLAPYSDLDLLFLFPWKQTAWSESVTEYILYMLWDLRLKVGHATRTVNETLKAARDDMTIRTALLEARPLAGDKALFEECQTRFQKEVVAGTARQFIAAKLAERDARHGKSGKSRYLVEPDVKDGMGGLRDLHTLLWIARYIFDSTSLGDLAERGIFTPEEMARFIKCEDFLWAVRCHMHFMTGRAIDRLTFELQADLAERLGYSSRGGLKHVERFMKHYFLLAKEVGDLSRIFCAVLEARAVKKAPGMADFWRGLTGGSKAAITPDGWFCIDAGRVNVIDEDCFARHPIAVLKLFAVADERKIAVHPDALKIVRRSLPQVCAQ